MSLALSTRSSSLGRSAHVLRLLVRRLVDRAGRSLREFLVAHAVGA